MKYGKIIQQLLGRPHSVPKKYLSETSFPVNNADSGSRGARVPRRTKERLKLISCCVDVDAFYRASPQAVLRSDNHGRNWDLG